MSSLSFLRGLWMVETKEAYIGARKGKETRKNARQSRSFYTMFPPRFLHFLCPLSLVSYIPPPSPAPHLHPTAARRDDFSENGSHAFCPHVFVVDHTDFPLNAAATFASAAFGKTQKRTTNAPSNAPYVCHRIRMYTRRYRWRGSIDRASREGTACPGRRTL